jgi:hypothetical protein
MHERSALLYLGNLWRIRQLLQLWYRKLASRTLFSGSVLNAFVQ